VREYFPEASVRVWVLAGRCSLARSPIAISATATGGALARPSKRQPRLHDRFRREGATRAGTRGLLQWTKTSTLAGAQARCATSDPAAVVARDQDHGTVACKTALLSAAVRRAVIFWYCGLATIWLNARRLG
jgi:hypothetical protein